ncbi:hypothetical protein PMIN03_012755 [Paraphaeosphaeria minitans]
MPIHKYTTEEERIQARREQNRRARLAYNERKRRQRNAIPSIDNDKRRAQKRTESRTVEQASKDVERPESEPRLPERRSARLMPENEDVESTARLSQSTTAPSVRTDSHVVEQASNDVGRLESGWRLPEHPSARLMLELLLTRIQRDVETIARNSRSTTDRSVSEYLTDQRPLLQRTIDILQAFLKDRSGSAEASVGDDQFQRGQHPAPHLPDSLAMLLNWVKAPDRSPRRHPS